MPGFRDASFAGLTAVRLQIARYLGGVQQPVNARRIVKRVVWLKRQIGRELQPQGMCDLGAEKRAGAPECRQQDIDVRPPQPRHIRHGVLQVRADPYLGHGDLRAGQFGIAEVLPFE